MVAYRYPGTQRIDPYWHDSLDDGTTARTRTPLPGNLKELYSALQSTTGAERDVATVLISSPVNSVDFRVDNIIINKTLMSMVHFAIISGKVKIKIKKPGGNFEALYSSWKHRRKLPGEEGKIGEIQIKRNAASTDTGKGAIFHECVHALKDLCNYEMASSGGGEMHRDEAFAYLAETLFISASKMKIPSGGLGGAVFTAAAEIVNSKDMLKRPGTVLKWSDFDALIKAVKAVPEYR